MVSDTTLVQSLGVIMIDGHFSRAAELFCCPKILLFLLQQTLK